MSTDIVETWDCPGCGEENEITFGECWNCSSRNPKYRTVLNEEDEDRKRNFEITKLSLRLSREQIELNEFYREQYILDIANAKKLSQILDKADRVLDNIEGKIDV